MTVEERPTSEPGGWSGQRWAELAGYGLIVGLAALVLSPFLVPITWAAILAYTSWPVFERLERLLGGWRIPAAAIMTVAIVLVVVVPAAVISVALVAEVQGAYAWLRENLAAGPGAAIAWVRSVPKIGPLMADRIGGAIADPTAVQQWVASRLGAWVGTVGSLAVGIGRGLFETIIVLMTLFVFYSHGADLSVRIRRAVGRLGGPRMAAMLGPLGETVRAVTYGTLLTALAQGTLIMIGCWAAGLGAPVLLGAIAGILGLTPIGTVLVWLPSSVWLMLQGRYLAGGMLVAWGLIVVGSVDNLIRSWFLSGAARIPFFLGLLGLLGGLAAFGTLGLFIGPVAVALVLTLWREWTEGGPAAVEAAAPRLGSPPPDARAGRERGR
jgi:predicted PurR-regulated permease PerM